MKKTISSKLIYALFLVMGLVQGEALACSCAQPGSPTDELKSSTAVFVGTVSEVKKESQTPFAGVAVKLAVDKRWKGLDWQKEIVVRTSANSAACGFHFVKGESYLVYADLTQQGYLSTNICTRTAHAKDAATDIAELGNPLP